MFHKNIKLALAFLTIVWSVFEFWQGHESRLNIRDVYEKNKNIWVHKVLEP